jgi:hypothetical protein
MCIQLRYFWDEIVVRQSVVASLSLCRRNENLLIVGSTLLRKRRRIISNFLSLATNSIINIITLSSHFDGTLPYWWAYMRNGFPLRFGMTICYQAHTIFNNLWTVLTQTIPLHPLIQRSPHDLLLIKCKLNWQMNTVEQNTLSWSVSIDKGYPAYVP